MFSNKCKNKSIKKEKKSVLLPQELSKHLKTSSIIITNNELIIGPTLITSNNIIDVDNVEETLMNFSSNTFEFNMELPGNSSLTVNNETVLNDIIVNNNATSTNYTTENLTVDKTIASNYTAQSNLESLAETIVGLGLSALYGKIFNNLNVGGNLTTLGDTVLNKTLNVEGDAIFKDSLKINDLIGQNDLNVIGNLNGNGDLNAGGEIIANSVECSGDATIGSNCPAKKMNKYIGGTGSVNISIPLTVNGNAVFYNYSTINSTINSNNLLVNGNSLSTIQGGLSVKKVLTNYGTVNIGPINNTTPNGLGVAGPLIVGNILNLNNGANINNSTIVSNGLSTTGNINVNNNTTISNGISVGNNPSSKLLSNNIVFQNTLNVNGYATLRSSLSIGTPAPTNVPENGIATAGDVVVNGNITTPGIINIGPVETLEKVKNVNNVNTLSNISTISNDLLVGGNGIFTSGLSIGGFGIPPTNGIGVFGNTLVDGFVTIQGSLNSGNNITTTQEIICNSMNCTTNATMGPTVIDGTITGIIDTPMNFTNGVNIIFSKNEIISNGPIVTTNNVFVNNINNYEEIYVSNNLTTNTILVNNYPLQITYINPIVTNITDNNPIYLFYMNNIASLIETTFAFNLNLQYSQLDTSTASINGSLNSFQSYNLIYNTIYTLSYTLSSFFSNLNVTLNCAIYINNIYFPAIAIIENNVLTISFVYMLNTNSLYNLTIYLNSLVHNF